MSMNLSTYLLKCLHFLVIFWAFLLPALFSVRQLVGFPHSSYPSFHTRSVYTIFIDWRRETTVLGSQRTHCGLLKLSTYENHKFQTYVGLLYQPCVSTTHHERNQIIITSLWMATELNCIIRCRHVRRLCLQIKYSFSLILYFFECYSFKNTYLLYPSLIVYLPLRPSVIYRPSLLSPSACTVF